MIKNNKKNIWSIVFIFLTFIFFLGANWAIKNFSFTFETLVFYLRVPSKGANFGPFLSFIKRCVLPATIFTSLFLIVLKNPFKFKFIFKLKEKIDKLPLRIDDGKILIVTSILLIISIIYACDKIGVFYYLNTQLSTSKFIEENYIDSKSVKIETENKRNLIYIYVESMEPTYLNIKDGGASSYNLMPNITKLSNEHINFSSNSLIGGAYNLPGTTWTVGAIVAQTAGIPLKIPIDENSYGNFESFLPGAYSLGDILKEQGYNQVFMMGSDAAFGGRDSYLKSHGEYTLYDYNKAIEKEKIASDYYVWWGFEDNKLFEYAKEEIVNLSKQDKPFNFTMLTVDMHFPDGYLSDNCEVKYKENLSNVVACTDNLLGDFIEWAKEQDFYQNTTIVIAGDHISMDGNYFKNISKDYKRTVYNLFINPCITTENYKNRNFSTFDMFPTTLASMCFNIEGNRLGLGTNLFSEEKTIVEKYSLEHVAKELDKRSEFFDNKIVYSNKKVN